MNSVTIQAVNALNTGVNFKRDELTVLNGVLSVRNCELFKRENNKLFLNRLYMHNIAFKPYVKAFFDLQGIKRNVYDLAKYAGRNEWLQC